MKIDFTRLTKNVYVTQFLAQEGGQIKRGNILINTDLYRTISASS